MPPGASVTHVVTERHAAFAIEKHALASPWWTRPILMRIAPLDIRTAGQGR